MLLLIKLLGLSGFGSKPNKCKLCFYAQTPPSLPPPTPPYTGGELVLLPENGKYSTLPRFIEGNHRVSENRRRACSESVERKVVRVPFGLNTPNGEGGRSWTLHHKRFLFTITYKLDNAYKGQISTRLPSLIISPKFSKDERRPTSTFLSFIKLKRLFIPPLIPAFISIGRIFRLRVIK